MPISRRHFLGAAGCGGRTSGARRLRIRKVRLRPAEQQLVDLHHLGDGQRTGRIPVRPSPVSRRPMPDAKVVLNSVPYAQMFTNIDAQLQAGNPPDIFRVPYYTFGRYAGSGQLLNLTSHLDKAFGDRFTPAAWAAVQNAGSPFGVPHHTDTSAILYNKAALASAGVTSIPTALDQAWTWEQFQQVLLTLRQKTANGEIPVRLQLAGERRHPLAQLPVRGGRSFPVVGSHRAGDRFRRRTGGRRLHEGLFRPAPGAGEQLGQIVDPGRRPLCGADHRDGLLRSIRHSRFDEEPGFRVGGHLLAPEQASSQRFRRQRLGGHRSDQRSRIWPRSSWIS